MRRGMCSGRLFWPGAWATSGILGVATVFSQIHIIARTNLDLPFRILTLSTGSCSEINVSKGDSVGVVEFLFLILWALILGTLHYILYL